MSEQATSDGPPEAWLKRSRAFHKAAHDHVVRLQRLGNPNQTDLLIECVGFLLHMLKEADDKIAALSRRVREIEETGGIKHRGPWKEGCIYNKGEWITHQGSLWLAKEANAARPGGDHGVWQLIVKRGRDGR
jgi:hypothetical protein